MLNRMRITVQVVYRIFLPIVVNRLISVKILKQKRKLNELKLFVPSGFKKNRLSINILRKSWIQKVTYAKILRQMAKEREVRQGQRGPCRRRTF